MEEIRLQNPPFGTCVTVKPHKTQTFVKSVHSNGLNPKFLLWGGPNETVIFCWSSSIYKGLPAGARTNTCSTERKSAKRVEAKCKSCDKWKTAFHQAFHLHSGANIIFIFHVSSAKTKSHPHLSVEATVLLQGDVEGAPKELKDLLIRHWLQTPANESVHRSLTACIW